MMDFEASLCNILQLCQSWSKDFFPYALPNGYSHIYISCSTNCCFSSFIMSLYIITMFNWKYADFCNFSLCILQWCHIAALH